MSPFQTLSLEELAAATGGKHKHAKKSWPESGHDGGWHGAADPQGAAHGPRYHGGPTGVATPAPTSGLDPLPAAGRTASSYRGGFR